jgi:lipoyl(octanoyl) transferase
MDQQNEWRLIITPPSSGAWNMAVDEAVEEAVSTFSSLPTLRLFAWNPACLSLGRGQNSSDVDPNALLVSGWDLVRRPTGGRAILHTDEITYSVILRQDHPIAAGGVLESYRRLAGALLESLQILGLQARADKTYDMPAGSKANAPVCFEVPSNYEITADGKKLIGSAQSRRLECVLQHGTLPLTGDLTRITRVLCFRSESERQDAAARLLEHATTLETVLNRAVSWQEAAEAFQQGFRKALGIQFHPDELNAAERSRAQALVATKFGHPDWTYRS